MSWCFYICLYTNLYRKAAKKLFLSGPATNALRPIELSGHIFWGILFWGFLRASKASKCQALTPPPLNGRATEIKNFIAASLTLDVF